MATPKEWADFLTGDYEGWARESKWPSGAWEDLIGVLTLRCSVSADGRVHAELTSLDLGPWSGELGKDGLHLSMTNEMASTIQFSIETERLNDGLQIRLRGDLRSASGNVTLGVSLRRFTQEAIG